MGTSSYAKPYWTFYDAYQDIGIVPENATPSVAASNTLRLTQAAAAMHPSGNFDFRRGKSGPILKPILFDGRNYHFSGTVYFPARYGGTIVGSAGIGPPMTETHSSLRGMQTRFNRIDGENGGAVLRLGSTNTTIEGIQVFGRRYITDSTGEGPQTGTKTPIGIEVEGRSSPPTGVHSIRNCAIAECGVGVQFTNGYYTDGSFTLLEQHADNCTFDTIWFHANDTVVKSKNRQAVNHNFVNIGIGGWGGTGQIDSVVLDLSEGYEQDVSGGGGGNIWFRGLSLNTSRTTLLKLGLPYSPWNSEIYIQNLKLDRLLGGSEYFKLIEYNPTIPGGLEWIPTISNWQIRVQGHIAYDPSENDGPAPDFSNLFDVHPDIPMNNWMFDVHSPYSLPGLLDVGDGPWKTPDPTYWQS